jgi:L-threonylcarbamoyladenylate synthase
VLGQSLGSAAENETRCSGRLDSHYAPGAAVELVKEAELPARYHHWQQQGASVGILAEVCPAACSQAMFVPLSSDPAACAQRLYAALREGDRLGANILLVVPPQEQGLGIAIADRLAKAAAPRS